jgi:phosphoribosylformylglycinamidine (FGAM) synthase-like amidotransferase family enzyme
MNRKALVLSGDGINCERESARAFREAGAEPTILHVNTLLENPKVLLEYQIFCLPGGFSFGDELRSGKILAEKMRVVVSDVFEKFTSKGGMTIGICNGFQVLIQLGVFSGLENERTSTLATNDHGAFLDRWVQVDLTETAKNSAWFKGMTGSAYLPIRHKEGRIVITPDAKDIWVPLCYHEPVNGSYLQAAALTDKTGQILGIMPHPEAATHGFLNPVGISSDTKEKNAAWVRKLFLNAVSGVNP